MSQKKSKRSVRREPAAPPKALLLVLGGVVLIGLAAFAAWRARPAPKVTPEVTGAPRLKADRQEADLGDVPLGQTVRVSFELTNVGDRPLRFTDVPYVEVVAGC
jgi:hypothetical protein